MGELTGFVAGGLSIVLVPVLCWFALEWRKLGGGTKEAARLREELAALRRDHEQLKSEHDDTLLGVEQDIRRLDARLDGATGVHSPEVTPAAPPAKERQL